MSMNFAPFGRWTLRRGAAPVISTLAIMKRYLSALVIAIFFAASACAEQRISLIQPEGTPLKVSTVTTKNEHYAEFAGEIWITGTLYVEWYGKRNPTAEYRLIPDVNSRRMLPHFSRYGVTWIGIKNGLSALEMAVPPSIFQRVSERQVKLFKVTGTWKLSHYSVGIECDAPYAYADVLAVKIPQDLIASIPRPQTC